MLKQMVADVSAEQGVYMGVSLRGFLDAYLTQFSPGHLAVGNRK
jgi:hypothetical protein